MKNGKRFNLMAVDSQMSPQGEPISARRVSMRVVTYLCTLIDTGELLPGDQLPPERELAHKLNVSRPSLRAGIAFLGMIGVLKVCHGSGTYVCGTPKPRPKSTSVSVDQQGPVSSQLFEACCVIKGAISGLAAERSSKRFVAELAEEVAEMYAAFNDPQGYSIHEVRFHQIIARAAGNLILETLLETLAVDSHNSQLQRAQPSQDLRQSAEIHHEIYRAIRSRNPARAKMLMEQHLREAFPTMQNCSWGGFLAGRAGQKAGL